MVTIGVPAQRTSMPVVWPLHSGVSRHTSASCPLLTCSSLGATGEKMTREPRRPMFWAYCWMLGSPTAGNRRSHNTLLGTRLRICREIIVLKCNFSNYPILVRRSSSRMSHAVSHYQTYIGPHLKSRRVDLVELIEVAVYDGILWQTILGASRHNNCAQHLLAGGSFVTDLKWANSCSESQRFQSILAYCKPDNSEFKKFGFKTSTKIFLTMFFNTSIIFNCY